MEKNHYIVWIAFIILSIASSCSSDPDPSPVGPPAPHISRQDSLALVALYKAGGGEFWDNKWDLNDFSTWTGVGGYLSDSATNEYRVEKLYLVCNTPFPKGVLSEEIGKLTGLRVLLIDGKGFEGALPTSISNLKNLEEISIVGTSIMGQIPEGILSLPKVWRIIMSECELSGELPKDITETAPSLTIVDLSRNHLRGELPNNIKGIRLDLDYNDYTKFPFEYIIQREELSFKGDLYMKHNKITGIIPDSILNNPKWIGDLNLYTNPQKKGYGYANAPWPKINNN